jgi:hypothetical protein
VKIDPKELTEVKGQGPIDKSHFYMYVFVIGICLASKCTSSFKDGRGE